LLEALKPLPVIRSDYGPAHGCRQCNGLVDGAEREIEVDGVLVLLHLDCEPYYRRLDTRYPRCGGGWG
jgi:hypothetical protein